MTKCLTRWWAPQKRVIRFFRWGASALRLFSNQHFAIQRPLSIVTVRFFPEQNKSCTNNDPPGMQAHQLSSCRLAS